MNSIFEDMLEEIQILRDLSKSIIWKALPLWMLLDIASPFSTPPAAETLVGTAWTARIRKKWAREIGND